MFKVKYPVVLAFLMAFFCLDSTSNLCYSQWFKSYELGLTAMGKNDWQQAIEHFKKALEAKSKDSNKIRARGVVFIEYYPNREIGICYYNIGQMDKAKQHLSTSISQIFSIRAKHYLNLTNKSPDSPKTPAPGYRPPDYQQPQYQTTTHQ